MKYLLVIYVIYYACASAALIRSALRDEIKRVLLLVLLIVSLVELDWERGRIYLLSSLASFLLMLWTELLGRRIVQQAASAEALTTEQPSPKKGAGILDNNSGEVQEHKNKRASKPSLAIHVPTRH